MEPQASYEFGQFRLDREARILLHGDKTVALTPKAVELLLVLVEKRGQLVTKDDLMHAVWPDTFVEEGNLTSNISILRRQLGEHPDGGEYIETIPKRGYRFVAAVTQVAAQIEDQHSIRSSENAVALEAAPAREEESSPASQRLDSIEVPAAETLAAGNARKRALRPRVALAASAVALVSLLVLFYLKGWHLGLPGPAAPVRIESLAVLPLENLSGDPAQEYFADGMTEALTADLAQIGALRVIARASVMQYKGTKTPLPEIAQRLNVDAVVSGTVLRSGQRVRITAALIRPATGQQLWAKTYEQNLGDILDLQNEVARAIAGEIHAKVTPQEQLRLARVHEVNPGAYEAYLKGRYYWHQFTEEALLKSIEYFEEAIKLDPGYAEAHAGLADAWISVHYIGAAPLEEAHPKALEAATKALQLDDTLAEAHAAMATIKAHEWDWATAERETRKAIELNPGYAAVHSVHSNRLRRLGRTEESIAEAKRGLELDPLSALTNESLGDAYLSAHQYDLAIEQYQKTLELYPNQSPSRDSLGWAYVYKGMYDKGIEEIKKSYGEDPSLSPELAYIHAMRGETSEAHKILERLLSLSKRVPIAPHHFALIYTGLGKKDEALTWLEKAYQQRSPMMTWLKVDPRFDSLRQDPRFQDLMRRVGLL